MRVVFEQWKYIFKNLWFLLPFALVPAIFLALSVDFDAVSFLVRTLVSGPFELEFGQIYSAWSFIRFDSVLGVIYSVLAFFCLVIFSAFLLAFVEKHMRIGKLTLSGVMGQVWNHLISFIGFVLFFVIMYEIWALVLSAVLYAVSNITSDAAARVLFIFISLIFVAVLLYLVTIIYLWMPCMMHTGFKAYHAFLYSYRLVVVVRSRLYLSLTISYAVCFLILFGSAFGPVWLSRLLAIILYVFAYMSFLVRMETLYFETDQLDREDLLHSFRRY